MNNTNSKVDQQKAQEDMNNKLKQNMSDIKHKILVLSNKGGVGKSSVSVNLSCALAEKGYKVGLLDADLHGPSVAKMLGFEGERLAGNNGFIEPIKVRENLKAVSMASLIKSPDTPLVWRGPLKGVAIKQFLAEVHWGKLDFLIIDSPPGTGDEPLSICQLIPELDGGVIVTTPQEIALTDSRKCIHFLRDINIPILGIIENMSGFRCPNCGEKIDLFMTGGGKKAADDFKVPFLGAIPIDVQMVKSGDQGQPFICSNGESETGQAFEEIVQAIISKINI
ncbi:MAG: Mrp/NBP35 family ATP-binding protein [Atribacterota bacterium]|nr:Mrp/NBP35 family ATP-binding protein [Atribacterota bacterium]MDD3640642.1 Mrp/NBP35 family ATP-binding protein [Atribacterota bacterium]MDD4765128.1 Mrp/NBP35 family ATP-binding protein [Atribacterota bacterium]MDD5635397.1 Mrp/NBP35 family ATP-binding protein [Atribacterota bacterium]MDI9597110.1 Mrp/NBP35 family ATP-binding protein [Atribacterota bacterium]